VLRAVAVLLVLGRHMVPCPPETNRWLHEITAAWMQGGWAGVDLFFVLSGFLVSGLLFKEHQLHGNIRVGRFFFRRGLKIYPAFAVFLLMRCAWRIASGGDLEPQRMLAEVTFTQNYFPGVWFHTWSLAVEEHFYLMLPLILVPLFRKSGRDPLRGILILFSVVAIGCLAFRLADRTSFYELYRHTTPTHKRIDSLFAGVMLSALYHYRREWLAAVTKQFRLPLMVIGIVCFSLPFIFPLEGAPWMYNIGYNALYLGAACVLAVAVTGSGLKGRFWQGLAVIGMDSYSVYLWHGAAKMMIAEPLLKRFPETVNWYAYAGIYLGGSIVIGILMSKLVEWPVLRLRDRYFPSRSKTSDSESELREQVLESNPVASR
jgi:peptidoglycan/LPS O-acetylase OafA/YrhL